MEITLQAYDRENKETILRFIAAFFHAHHSQIDEAQARENLENWTDTDHELFYILGDGKPVGFLHLCSKIYSFPYIYLE
jgi:glutamate synthase domain-containing protein 3